MKGDPALRAMMMSTRRPRLWRPTRVEAVQASRHAIYIYVVDPTQFFSLPHFSFNLLHIQQP